MKMGGVGLIFLACATAALLAVPAASHTGLATTFSLACSSAAFAGMAMSQVLATRLKPVEFLFGGLDRVYAAHKKLGIAILFLILAHYYVTPDFQGLALSSEINKLAAQMGKVAFYFLMALILFSLVARIPKTRIEIPYQAWRFSHRFIGLGFIVVALHMNFIKRPFDSTALLAGYLNLCAAAGIASYLYIEIFARMRRRRYVVTGVVPTDGATLIRAKPVGKPLRIKPGQFVFLKVYKAGLREAHPFTVAGIEQGGSVAFAIKPLGDFTKKLRANLKPGDRLALEGGYGHFNYAKGADRQIWLAGGIGITPFLAMLESVPVTEARQVHLVYCVRNAKEAVGVETLKSAAERVEKFSYTLHDSSQRRLDADLLAELVGFDASGAELWFCGPAPLRKAIESGLKKAGKAPARVEFERFQFR